MAGDFGGFAVLRCPYDRGVSCASAQVAGQLSVVIRGAVQMGGCHRYHEARCAEPALAAMPFNQRVLYRMQRSVRGCDAFYRPDGLAVDLGHEENAGIERFCARSVGHHDSAGAAVSFVAAFLGAFQALIFAKPVK